MKKQENAVWYAMRVTYCRELDIKRLLDREAIGNFIPMHYEFKRKGKERKRILTPVIHNLIFVYTTPSRIQQIKKGIPYLQYIIDSRNRNKIIVPEEQMSSFIAVAGTPNDQLLYINPEEVNLSKGTKVRICGGTFENQEGIFIKKKGTHDGRVVVAIQGLIAVAITAVHPKLIEVIS